MAMLVPHRPVDMLDDLADDVSENMVLATARLWRAAGQHPEKSASVARILNAVAWLTEESGAPSMREAAGAPTDFSVLVDLLHHPDVLDAIRRQDPLAQARIRGFDHKRRMLADEGGTMSSREAAALLGLTRQTVDNRRKASRLVAVDLGRHGFAYPAWQFTSDGVLAGLDQMVQAFGPGDPWGLMAFVLSGNARLNGQRPLDVLREGSVEQVVEAASQYGQQSAL